MTQPAYLSFKNRLAPGYRLPADPMTVGYSYADSSSFELVATATHVLNHGGALRIASDDKSPFEVASITVPYGTNSAGTGTFTVGIEGFSEAGQYQPDGVVKGSTSAAYSAPASGTTQTHALAGAKPTLNEGDAIMVCFRPSATGSAKIRPRYCAHGGIGAAGKNRYNGSWGTPHSGLPMLYLTASDGRKGWISGLVPITSFTSVAFNSGSADNFLGNRITLPVACRINTLWAVLNPATNGDFALALYVESDSNPVVKVSRKAAEVRNIGSEDTAMANLPTSYEIPANTPFHAGVLAEGSGNVTMKVGHFDSDLQKYLHLGTKCVYSKRSGAGVYTVDTGKRASAGVYLASLDDMPDNPTPVRRILGGR